jgi:hypothetical protein
MDSTINTPIKKNHLLNLLNRKNYIKYIKDFKNIDHFNMISKQEKIEKLNKIPIKLPDNLLEIEPINLDRIATNLKKNITNKSYRNPKNILHRLNIKIDKKHNIINISVPNVSNNLKYSDPVLNRALHQSKSIVFDINNYYPLFYLENKINSSDISPIDRENSYLTEHLYNVMKSYKNSEFDNNKVKCYKNHIGSYIVIFYNINKWMFFFEGKTYNLCIEKHAVLYEHIGNDLDRLDKQYCYHIILVDPRLRIILPSPNDSRYMVLVKINQKYNLQEYEFNHPAVPNNLFVENKRIYFSCLDQLDLYLEEMNNINTRNKKLYNRGLIVKVYVNNSDPIYILYDTYTYGRLKDMIPNDMTKHQTHLYLYQKDKLNNVLQYIEESDNAALIVTRINLAIVTLGREILDIYHYTRNKENPKLFSLLSHAYRDLMHNLHGQFINKKSTRVNNQYNNQYNNYKKNHSYHKFGSDIGKISITTENVYTTLKTMDTMSLVRLFLDRDILKEYIDKNKQYLSNKINEIIKNCDSTSLQTRLLKY